MAKPKARPSRSSKSATSTANRRRDDEYKRLIGRAETVAKRLNAADDDEAYRLEEGAWAKVLESFDAWASKYGVKVKTGQDGHGPGTGAGGGPVPRTSGCPAVTRNQENIGETRIIVTTCLFKRRTWTGRCVYKCYSSEVNVVYTPI
jgi:hypothetical protein